MLFLIDLQNDYFDKKGKYYFEGASSIVPGLTDRIKRAVSDGEDIVYTLNRYTEKDGRSEEERLWASSLYGEFKELLQEAVYLEKFYYGISEEAASYLRKIYGEKGPERIELAGAETNLCVMANAVVVQNMYPESEIVLKRHLLTSSDLVLQDYALTVMENMNMNIET